MNAKDFVLSEAGKGMTNDEFLALMEKEIKEKDTLELQEEEKYLLDITKLNFQRSSRIKKTYKPSDEIISAIENIEKKQLWMVLTEPWCGDSAQNLPYIAKIAELNYNIDFRILLRDENPEIMDQYLTNGKSRSIPKLVAFDDEGKELFQWGPRPKLAQEMVNNWKAEGLSKDEFIEKLHLWYGRNRGEELEKEFIELLMRK